MALGSAIAKYKNVSRTRAIEGWARLQRQVARVREEGKQMVHRASTTGVTLTTFGGLYYARKRLLLAGKRVTFDEDGRIDMFFWPGLAVAVAGIAPIFGDASPYVCSVGVAGMCVGATGFLDELAAKHAA